MTSFSSNKFENYITKKNFVRIGNDWKNDTVIHIFRLKKKGSVSDSIAENRDITTYTTGNDFSFSFQTSSGKEYEEVRNELKKDGFFCGNETEISSNYLYQRKNISVKVIVSINSADTNYIFHFREKELQPISKVRFAEDLLQYSTHEYLVSIFGEKNVQKDLYYFSNKEIMKCSVLFPRTEKQAVFIWGDEINLCGLTNIIIGGNIANGKSLNYNEVIAENSWKTKEGIYSGMSLTNLAKLNGNDFKIFGKNSEFPYMVVPENTGNINFKKNVVVLGSLSNNSTSFFNKELLTANDALQENAGMFVFMYMLSPPQAGL